MTNREIDWVQNSTSSVDAEISRLEEIGEVNFAAESFSVAIEYLEKALRQANSVGSPRRFYVALRLSDCFRRKGEIPEAKRRILAASAMLPDEASSADCARLEYREAYVMLVEGLYEKALITAEEAYVRLRATDDHHAVASIQTLLGHCHLRLGEFAKAEAYFTDSLSSYRRVEYEVGECYAYNNIALVRKNACRWDEAVVLLRKSLDIAIGNGLATIHLTGVAESVDDPSSENVEAGAQER
jgi:tetratricopeptide (TPR) repeat protein